MTSQMDFLRELLRTEHVALARGLAQARDEAELREAAEAALAFASTLLAERDSPRNTHNFLGVPFWYFPTAASFLRGWPAIAAGELGLPEPAAEGGPPEQQVSRLAQQAAGHRLLLLWQKTSAPGAAPEGPLLMVDISLASAEQLLTFLFGIALRRRPTRQDLEALNAEILKHPEGSVEQAAQFCAIILGSQEAQMHGPLWERC